MAKSEARLEEARGSWLPDRAALYEPALRRWSESMAAFDARRTPPEAVAKVVEKALSASRPKRRYSVGHMSRAAAFLESLPQALGDRLLKARFRLR